MRGNQLFAFGAKQEILDDRLYIFFVYYKSTNIKKYKFYTLPNKQRVKPLGYSD